MCLIKGAFVREKNFERYQNARYNNKKIKQIYLLLSFNSITQQDFLYKEIALSFMTVHRSSKRGQFCVPIRCSYFKNLALMLLVCFCTLFVFSNCPLILCWKNVLTKELHSLWKHRFGQGRYGVSLLSAGKYVERYWQVPHQGRVSSLIAVLIKLPKRVTAICGTKPRVK